MDPNGRVVRDACSRRQRPRPDTLGRAAKQGHFAPPLEAALHHRLARFHGCLVGSSNDMLRGGERPQNSTPRGHNLCREGDALRCCGRNPVRTAVAYPVEQVKTLTLRLFVAPMGGNPPRGRGNGGQGPPKIGVRALQEMQPHACTQGMDATNHIPRVGDHQGVW